MDKTVRSTVRKRAELAIAVIALLALPDFFFTAEHAQEGPHNTSRQRSSVGLGSRRARAAAAACSSPDYTVTPSTGEIVPGADDIGNHGDNVTTEITLPFSYKLYDKTFTTARVSSNGVLQFVSNNADGNNSCLPNDGFDYAIFAHWDDLCTSGDCSEAGTPDDQHGIFTATFGEPGDRVFVIEWRAVYAQPSAGAGAVSAAATLQAGGTANFEIRLFEGQKKFEIIYGTLTEEGCSATVGVQKDTGSCFTEYSCGTGCGQAAIETNPTSREGAVSVSDAVALTEGLRLTFEEPPQCTLFCPEDVQVVTDGACGANVNFQLPTTSGSCDEVVCTDAEGNPLNPGDFFLVGTTTVLCSSADAACSFNVTVSESTPPMIACSRDISVANVPGLCGATVAFEVSAIDNCGDPVIVCNPPAGFFPVGTTTVNCTAFDASGNTATCSFSVTVNDTEAPRITCPGIVSANSLGAPCAQVGFAPSVFDNCGADVVCNPPSGSCFPLGTTSVTCTATDSANNSASCSFNVLVFNLCLQDDSNAGVVFLGDTTTGDYLFCCGGTVITGRAKVTIRGRVATFEDNQPDRRVLARDDESVFRGFASLQSPPGTIICSITDRDTRNNACVCQTSGLQNPF